MAGKPEQHVEPETKYRLRGWMAPGTAMQIRMAPPVEAELLANAESALAFEKALNKAMQRHGHDETVGEPLLIARRAVAAALLQDQCDALETRSEYIEEPEDGNPDAEDATPEELRVKETLARLRGSTTRAVRKAGAAETTMFDGDRGPWSRRYPNPRLHVVDSDEIAADARALATIGHCAALKTQLDALAGQQGEITEESGGRTLALWPHYRSLQVLKQEPEPPPQQALPLEAYRVWRRTMDQYQSEANMQVMEDNRPVQISRRASNTVGDEALKLADQFKGAAPDTDAVFDWGTGDGSTATIAYRYQGCTHVKLLTEPYEHPIDRITALEHCEDLDSELIENVDPWDPDALDPATMSFLHQSMLNRSLVIANLHYIDLAHIDMVMDLLQAVVRERTRQEDFVNAIAGNQQEIVRHLKQRYGLEYPGPSEGQITAAIRAARSAGASDPKLRDMAIRLGVAVERLPRMGLTIPERLPAGDAREIMLHMRDLTARHRWEELANVIGWDDRDPRLADPDRRDEQADEDED